MVYQQSPSVCIGAGEYIDFTELPPAKGKPKTVLTQLEGYPILLPLQDATGDAKN